MVDSKHQEILTALKAITNVSIPKRSDPQAKNIKKKQRGFQKNQDINLSRGTWKHRGKSEQDGQHGKQRKRVMRVDSRAP